MTLQWVIYIAYTNVICRYYNVKEVLELLEDQEFDSAQIYIEPPDDGNESKEDSGDEDSVGCVNNLSGKQLQGLSSAKLSCHGRLDVIMSAVTQVVIHHNQI